MVGWTLEFGGIGKIFPMIFNRDERGTPVRFAKNFLAAVFWKFGLWTFRCIRKPVWIGIECIPGKVEPVEIGFNFHLRSLACVLYEINRIRFRSGSRAASCDHI